MKKITIFDICIICFFILLIVLFVFAFIKRSKNNSQLFIRNASEEFYYSLSQKKKLRIKGNTGITVIEIENGRFRFQSSPCPHKDCIKMGWISLSNYPVICLPNKVSAYIISNKKDDLYDGISR